MPSFLSFESGLLKFCLTVSFYTFEDVTHLSTKSMTVLL